MNRKQTFSYEPKAQMEFLAASRQLESIIKQFCEHIKTTAWLPKAQKSQNRYVEIKCMQKSTKKRNSS